MYYRLMDRLIFNFESLTTYIETVEESFKLKQDLINKAKREVYSLQLASLNAKKERNGLSKEQEEIKIKLEEKLEELNEDLNVLDNSNLNDKLNDREYLKQLIESIDTLNSQIKHTEILYSGTLMLLVVYFEGILSDMLLEDLLKYPRIKIDDYKLTYERLKDLGSIEDAKKLLIEEVVDTIMKENPDEWFKHLKNYVKLRLESYNQNKSKFNEIMARRNLIVHNDGYVNNYYLNRVSSDNIYEAKEGDILRVNREYIKEAINIFTDIGICTLMELNLKEKLDEDDILKLFNLVTENFLFNGRYETALKLYKLLLDSKYVDGEMKIMCQLNYWQCYKWLGKSTENIKEIVNGNYSAYQPKYQLGALALQEKNDAFFELFANQDQVSLEELKEWPIFKSIREDERYKELIGENILIEDEDINLLNDVS